MNVLVILATLMTSTWAMIWPSLPIASVIRVPASDSMDTINKTATVVEPMLINSRIVNGRPASIDQFPWFASVRSHTEHGQQSICGGSIIATEWVLTAAHCTRGFDSFTLGFGSNLLNSPMITMHTRHVIEHVKYNPKLLNYDIAMIKLPNPLQYTVKIQAIRLPTVSQGFTGSSLKYAKARVCGYGRTTDGSSTVALHLNWVEKRIITNDQCTKTYGSTVIVPSTICAIGWESNDQSTCNGDSGGPLVIDEGGVYTQIGIVSFVSNQGCASGHPAGYVRLTSFLNWISTNAGIKVRP